jgi:hypothetical protein
MHLVLNQQLAWKEMSLDHAAGLKNSTCQGELWKVHRFAAAALQSLALMRLSS